jgi:hypothetical protein
MGVEEFSFIYFYLFLKKEEFQVITTLLKLHIVFSNKLFCLFFLSHVNEEFKLKVLISPLLFIRLAAFQGFFISLFWGCNRPFYHQKQTETSYTTCLLLFYYFRRSQLIGQKMLPSLK